MRWIWMLALSAVTTILTPAAASSCGNEVRPARSDEAKAIVKAEAHLEKREYRKAVRVLIATYRYGLMSNRGASSERALRLRSRRIAALVGVRTRGAVSLDRLSTKSVTAKAAQRQLKWSARQLKRAHTTKPEDPA
ncbi:MAG: hypothetical protein ACI9U2_005216, partial [Bradymonadia bacterium]